MVAGAEHSREQHGFSPPTGSCPKGNTRIYCCSFVLFQSHSRRSRVKIRWGGRKKEMKTQEKEYALSIRKYIPTQHSKATTPQ